MDVPTIAAFSSLVVALVAVLTLAAPVYLRLGRLEVEVKAGRERADAQYQGAREWSDTQYQEARERSDTQYQEARERSDTQYQDLRERADAQYQDLRERADAQHAEVLAEIRRLTDAFVSHSHAPDGGIIFRIPPLLGEAAE